MIKSSGYLFFMFLFLISCGGNKQNIVTVQEYNLDNQLPYWTRDANMYQVNISQYTPEGTFVAFTNELQRLKNMEVDIIWLTAPHCNSENGENCYYNSSDYKTVNANYGTNEDLKKLVEKIHFFEMHVIIDWTLDETSSDHNWASTNPEWYKTDNFPELDYENEDLWNAIIETKLFWINEFGFDGFREFTENERPQTYWEEHAQNIFRQGKSILMLADSKLANTAGSEYFQMNYDWSFHNTINNIITGNANTLALEDWLTQQNKPENPSLLFSHILDKNDLTNNNIKTEHALAAFCATMKGIPMIVGGQEEPQELESKFIEIDTIQFEKYEHSSFYRKLNILKHSNKALWNGIYGGQSEILLINEQLIILKSKNKGDSFYGIYNLSDEPASFRNTFDIKGIDYIRNSKVKWSRSTGVSLEPWGYYLISDIATN